jgi:hypothetical protein
MNTPTGTSSEPLEKTLERILHAVETKHRKGWVELCCALVLSLTTMCSAWCAYQSKLWGGVAGSRGEAASAAMAKAAENRLTAGEFRIVEAALFIKYFEAKNEGKDQLAEAYAARLPPSTRAAVAAWWKTDPLKNPDAPRSPFLMPEYRQALVEEAKQLEQEAREAGAEARKAGRNSDTYVLLTVLFASVLFFGGIGGTFESQALRRVVLSIALVLFLVTFSVLATMPVTWS